MMICTVRIGFFILGCNGTVFKLSWCSDSVLRRKITSKQLFINSVCSTEEGAHKNDERFNYLWKKVRVRDFCSFLGSKITATIWLIIIVNLCQLKCFQFFYVLIHKLCFVLSIWLFLKFRIFCIWFGKLSRPSFRQFFNTKVKSNISEFCGIKMNMIFYFWIGTARLNRIFNHRVDFEYHSSSI